ncbi:hypothetical protein LIA77_05126 [Sarocladium implicatum]|nr:hypothetical protein LIA77_05126 [Sarocladium implicatum]
MGSQLNQHAVHSGVQAPTADKWVAFEWEEPKLGKQVHGEITTARSFGTSGKLSSGFWRSGPTAPGANSDGSHRLVYSAPLGDELACVIDGSATLTVVSTGEKFDVSPGSIDTANPSSTLQINHVSDNPKEWTDYHFTEPKEGPQVAGELYFIKTGGSTGTFLSGVWRSGKGIAGTNVDEHGTLVTPYTGVLGDETILLLEGEVDVIETETGKKHSFKAGDAIGLSSGMHITWTSKGPFSKKLWVITKDEITEE